MSKNIALVLAGCGHKDGTEITEVVSAWLALSELGVTTHFFAPDIDFAVKDPITAQPTGETRRVLLESARIARGHVRPLDQLRGDDFDAVIFPGGFGAATNLSSWADDGAGATVDPQVARVLEEFHARGKPIGAICIAPTLVARVLGHAGVSVTIGRDPATAAEIEKTGALHEPCAVDDFISDREHRIVTTPAYMYGGAEPFAVYTGIRRAVREIVEMA
jgi:enhancing lycopene biosynthesis protein 2